MVFVRERGVVATNLVRSARKPAAGTSSTRGGRVPGALDNARNTSADGTAHRHRADWRRDQTDGTALGVSGTPTFFVNGARIEGASLP